MTILGALAVVAGLIGCVIPAIPGPILAYLSMILLSIPGGWALYQVWLLVLMGAVALIATIMDNVLPAVSSKKSGAGKAGVWGSVAGMIAGSFLFPPFGTIIGAFVGALIGEMIFNRENKKPLKAALGVFKGTMLGILLKLAAVGMIAVFYVRGAIRLLS